MRVLVTAASKYGATDEIAHAIGDTLTDAGHHTTVVAAADVAGIDGYDAVVIGSAVYAGHWLDAAKQLVTSHAEALRARPVWLFSSGPIGDPPKPAEDPVDATEMIESSGARSHEVFGGKLDRSKLRFAEKAIVVALRAPEGDFRDFDEIRTWARGIAEQLDHRGNTP
jgi:menaquinone-dependent protoporphyrinogen oxidase